MNNNINEEETSAQKTITPSAFSVVNANAEALSKAKTQNVKSPDRKWFLHRVVQQLIPSISAQVIQQKQEEEEMRNRELEAQQQQQQQNPESPQEEQPQQ
jgi:hypothetical protein